MLRTGNFAYHQSVATGANEHPCAVAPLGYVPVPELPAHAQVLSISNAFCIHICQRRTSSKTVVELCKDSFYRKRKSFSSIDSLFCDSYLALSLPPPALPICASPAYPLPKGTVHVAKGTSLTQRRAGHLTDSSF